MFPEAIAELEKAVSLSGGLTTLGELGLGYAVAGRRDEAMKILEALREEAKVRYVPSRVMAEIHMGLGEKDEAFRWLETAYQERNIDAAIRVYPIFDPLRDDPRFQDLLRRMNLEP